MKKYILISLSILLAFLGWEFLAAKLGLKKFTTLFTSPTTEIDTAASKATKTETVEKDGKQVLKVTVDKSGMTVEEDGSITTKDGWVFLPDGTIIKPDGSIVVIDSEVMIENKPRSTNLFSNIYNGLFDNTPAPGGRGTNNTPLEDRTNTGGSQYTGGGYTENYSPQGEQTT